jgi:DNA (cytosine-5)-methyltransferase 1
MPVNISGRNDKLPARSTFNLRAVDFFCGAGGMSYGLQKSGIQILAGIDNDPDCRETYVTNIKGSRFIEKDLTKLSCPDLSRLLGLRRDDPNLVFAGCSPCQYWSKIRTDKGKSEKSAFLLRNFERYICYFRPGFVVVENVPGLLTNMQESILPGFVAFLEGAGYSYEDGIVNANNFGVPQNRKRYLLIASRTLEKVTLPRPEKNPNLVVGQFIGTANGFARIEAGSKDTSHFQHAAAALTEQNLKRIRLTPKSGGNSSSWRKIPELQIPAYRGRDDVFRDVYGRMFWDRPAPTITTRFNSLSNGRFGHPDEDRAISVREGATLQTFPKTYIFKGRNRLSVTRQIGNAVPPEMARRIGVHLLTIANHG